MTKFIQLLLVITFVACAALAIAANKGPEVIKIPATLGEITFNHIAHQEKVNECSDCHHKGQEYGKCTGCHGFADKKDFPGRKKAFHAQCKGCHQKTSGPTSCKGCHSMSR